jgi:hypothetical protein
VGCLYCGKDIGPFRLFRDDEFCSSAHRQRYNDRLEKALDQLGAAELVPSGTPGARELWPLQEWRRKQTEGSWDFGHLAHPVQTGEFWPFRVAPRLGAGSKPLAAPEPVPGEQPQDGSKRPPRPLATPLSLPVLQKARPRGFPVPAAARAANRQVGMAPRDGRPKASVLLLPVRRRASAKSNPANLIRFPAFQKPWRGGLPTWDAAATGSPQRAIAPHESRCKARVFPLPLPGAISVKPKAVEHACHPALPRFEERMPSPAAEPVAVAVAPHFCLTPAGMPRAEYTALEMPALEHLSPIHASLEDLDVDCGLPAPTEIPVAVLDGALPLSICPPVAGPGPTPVQSLFSSSLAPSLKAVAPGIRTLPLTSAGQVCELAFSLSRPMTPAPGRSAYLTLTVAAPASSPFEPVPEPMRPSAIVLSLSRSVRPGTGSGVSQMGRPAGLSPGPADSLPTIAAFAPFRIAGAASMRMPHVPRPERAGASAAGPGQSYATFAAPEPQDRNPNAAVFNPISPLRVNRLAVPADRPNPAIPRPGFVPIEFHCQRGLVSPRRPLNWNASAVAPQWPPFAMRVAVDRTEDLAPWKPASKAAARHEIPSLPEEAKRRARERAVGRFLKIAACLVMGVFLWFGSREMRIGGSHATANGEPSGASASAPKPADTLRAGAPPARKSQGPLARVRNAIANRAAYAVTDTLQTGMQSWGSPPKAWAPGWSRNPDGYVHPGELALFRPSMTYTDYRLEFFGQIESRSMGWVVRAHDKQNYYAMKFTVLEAGLRPVIAMAHYPVVDGKKGPRVQAPLSVMVHNNTPLHVAVDVRGNRVTASIEGQQVDSWTDDLLPAGGVGFFSESGERARLYWMRVSKNQDWLGVLCSYLSADSAGSPRETAEVWGHGIPADSPAPTAPAQPQDVALAEAGNSTNDSSDPQRAGVWMQRRIRPWSS